LFPSDRPPSILFAKKFRIHDSFIATPPQKMRGTLSAAGAAIKEDQGSHESRGNEVTSTDAAIKEDQRSRENSENEMTSTDTETKVTQRPHKSANVELTVRRDPIFVSHVSEDRDRALEVVGQLERRGYRCWIVPRNVRAGRPFDDEIVSAIERCSSMLLIFSDRCNNNN
jgi:hypothetical protein